MPLAIFDDVRHLLVNDDNPAREEGDLDYERCAALHNAIVKYSGLPTVALLMNCPRSLPGKQNQTSGNWTLTAFIHP